jgi:hypothetical protein
MLTADGVDDTDKKGSQFLEPANQLDIKQTED